MGAVDVCLSEMSIESSLSGHGREVDGGAHGDVDELEVNEEELEGHVPREAEPPDGDVDGLMTDSCMKRVVMSALAAPDAWHTMTQSVRDS